MRHNLRQLLRVQTWILLLSLFMATMFARWPLLTGIAAGGLLSISTTLMAMMIFRRMPQVVSAKTFFGAMVLYELMKWLMIAALGVALIKILALPPLGLIIGFIVVQMAYFWLMARQI